MLTNLLLLIQRPGCITIILLLCVIFIFLGMSNQDSLQLSNDYYEIGFSYTTSTISIYGDSTMLNINVEGDSLIISGDMQIDAAAKIFFQSVFMYNQEFESLRKEILYLKNELDNCEHKLKENPTQFKN